MIDDRVVVKDVAQQLEQVEADKAQLNLVGPREELDDLALELDRQGEQRRRSTRANGDRGSRLVLLLQSPHDR